MEQSGHDNVLLTKNRELEIRCRALQETVRMQGRFADLASVLSSVVELPKLAEVFLPALLSAADIRAAAFCLREDEGTFRVLGSPGLALSAEGTSRVLDLCGRASLQKDIVSADAGAADGLSFSLRGGERGGPVPSALAAVPCTYEGNTNSVLVFVHTAPLSIDTISFLSAFMPNIGLSVNNALSYDKIRKTTEDLESERTRLNAVMYNMADGLLVADPAGMVLRANRALLEMFGYGKQRVTGQKAASLFGPAVQELVAKCMQSRTRTAVSSEIPLTGERIAKALATPLSPVTVREEGPKGANAAWTGAVILFRDITREKEVDRMKTDFLSTVSHELRTPLTSVLGFARIIKKKMHDVILPNVKADDAKIQKSIRQVGDNIDIIVSEGERLTSLINDVLDLAKMEAGKIEWNMGPLSAAEVVKRASSTLSSLLEQKGLALRLDLAEDLPSVTGDKHRLMQVVINLISNAVKFTETGTITCSAASCEGGVVIGVRDTGAGIVPEDIRKIFEKFKQVGDTLTNKPKGTGLGLPICREIVQRHGGRIWAESEPGKGSAFFFTLPAGPAEAITRAMDIETFVSRLREHVTALPASPEGGKRILVVDDEAHIRGLLRQELEAQGYGVHEARDGMEAVEQAKQRRPHLIILDVMMPGINGFDVAAVLKNDPATRDIPIMIHSIVDDAERGYRIGVDRYLKKPADGEELIRAVGDLLSRGVSNKKVFVVDEDESLVKTLSDTLRMRGYHAVGMCSGRECIEKALAERPDMIIIDGMFSECREIMRTLKFEKNMRNIYFVIIGGQAREDA
jgi:PAS domain S-box-containing protein